MGARILRRRKEKGLTQEELANKLGVSNQAVSKWEGDVCCPDLQLLPLLATQKIRDYHESISLYMRTLAHDGMVSLTELARQYSDESPGYVIQSWMRSRNTLRRRCGSDGLMRWAPCQTGKRRRRERLP